MYQMSWENDGHTAMHISVEPGMSHMTMGNLWQMNFPLVCTRRKQISSSSQNIRSFEYHLPVRIFDMYPLAADGVDLAANVEPS
jgi:hypothetical protein